MFTSLDLLVVCAYCFLFLGLGWYFRRFTRSSSDYFRGGGRMPWWLIGASSFMSTFSAWTFTGAAGMAYDQGIVVITFYLINALSLVFAACFLASWYRQTRVITAMEAVAHRFGRANEQIFTWLQLPIQLIISAVWLYGMAIFLAPILGTTVPMCILVGGVVVVGMSSAGGSWAVLTGDFVQALLLVPITGVLAFLALRRVGGLDALVHKLPVSHLDPVAAQAKGFGLWWIGALIVEKFVLQNGLANSTRFLAVRSSSEARKAAILAGALTTVGALIWFIPPFVAHAIDLKSPAENVYAAMALALLPHGALGLLVAGILGTTLSAMDTGLNRNSGIFVRSVYRPLFRPKADEPELVRVGKVTTLAMGGLIIAIAFAYNAHAEIGIFRLMMDISAMLGVPIGIPLFLGLFVRRAPDWAAWSTVAVGLVVSVLLWLTPGWTGGLNWLVENEYAGRMLINSAVCCAWFLGTTRFWGSQPPERVAEVAEFFRTMHTRVTGGETDGARDAETPRRIGRLCLIYAGFFSAIDFFPNSTLGRLVIGFCAAFFLVVSGALHWAARPGK